MALDNDQVEHEHIRDLLRYSYAVRQERAQDDLKLAARSMAAAGGLLFLLLLPPDVEGVKLIATLVSAGTLVAGAIHLYYYRVRSHEVQREYRDRLQQLVAETLTDDQARLEHIRNWERSLFDD